MIKKFNNFDVQEYINSKRQIKEAVNIDDEQKESIDLTEDDVITGTAVYTNPYLSKITRIILRKLKRSGLGEFGVCHDIIYIDGIPGVWIYGIDDNTKNIVCCRDRNVKVLSVFNSFNINATNKAITTYSTQKLGFQDMIDEMVYDLTPHNVNEARHAGGWSDANLNGFMTLLNPSERDYAYSFIRNFGKQKSIDEFYSQVKSKNPDAMRVIIAFVGGKECKVASGDGQSKYLMNLAFCVVAAATDESSLTSTEREAVETGILNKLILEYKGGAPAIKTSVGDEYKIADVSGAVARAMSKEKEEKEADIEAAKKDAIEYEETITGLRDITEAMCNYVKQSGTIDNEDKSVMYRRGVLLTGSAGIGKTRTIKQVLKEKGMVENKDYVWFSSDTTTSDAIYSTMYEFNGKLIIFDDSPKLFDGEYRVSMWKNALQTDIDEAIIGYPRSDSKLNIYNIRRLKGNRQKQYYIEIGHKSIEDKQIFYKKEMKKYNLTYSKISPGKVRSSDGLSNDEINQLMSKIDEEWTEEERNLQPSMPNQFIYKGVVIIISNDSREKFKESVGKGGWEAITSRFINFDISPRASSLWNTMKNQILNEFNDKSIDDDLCLIPRDMTEEFINKVDELIVEPEYQNISWRTIRAFGNILRGMKGRRKWISTLESELSFK